MKKNKDIYITVNTKKGKEDMHIDHFTRWMCLMEAIDVVDQKCAEWGKDIEEIDWVKPIAFQKYINERFHSMKHDVRRKSSWVCLTNYSTIEIFIGKSKRSEATSPR
jgi:hypothetical protein